MNPDREDLDITELLSVIGQVGPPSSDALEDAREVLWSAVTEEMLSANDARTCSGSAATDCSTAPTEQFTADRTTPQIEPWSVTMLAGWLWRTRLRCQGSVITQR